MSAAFFIVLDEKKPGFNTFVNGKALARQRDLDEMARKLGVRPLTEFGWVSKEEIAGQAGAEPRTEVVAKLGIRREQGYLYYLKGAEVWRKAKGHPEEKVSDANLVRDEDWLYMIDKNGDVVRTAKHRPPAPDEPFFAPEDGLATVRALRAHYAQTADGQRVVDDLDEYDKVLSQAAAKGFRFHLAVDY